MNNYSQVTDLLRLSGREASPQEWTNLAVVVRPGISPCRRAYPVIKRALDLTLCLATLPLALLVMGAIALAIWLESPGPAMFVQVRTGKGGRRFRMYKFRTMVRNAEQLKSKYAHLNELTWPDFKISDDPRQTRVGRWLRKTSLDELPQIFNVIKGEMSLVGPRPTSFAASTYDLDQTERLEVLPGVTGLWQIKGRADVDFDERVELDIRYIEQQSLWLDLQILWATAGAVLSHRGAY
jgi:lipopolysaccharide/colanic/teichoic acid biosynthesis glycosyltransferase